MRGGPRATSLEFRAGTNVTDPFLRGERRLGLRACIDTVEPAGTPSVINGLERVEYGQFYRGIRVFGRGYVVMRDPATDAVKTVVGTITPQINAETEVLFAEPDAWLEAMAAVDSDPDALYDPSIPFGELVLMPKTQGPNPQYELSWLFEVPAADGHESYDVAISARDGALVMSRSTLDTVCNTTVQPPDGTPVVVSPLRIEAVPQAGYPDPKDAQVTRVASQPDSTVMLYSKGAPKNPNRSEWFVQNQPTLRAMCGQEPSISAITAVPNVPMTVTTNPLSEDTAVAHGFLAAQTCVEVLSRRFKNSAGTPWLGIDGVGNASVDLLVSRGDGSTPAAWSFARNALLVDPMSQPWMGAALEVACHEIGHALWHGFPKAAPPTSPRRPQYGLETLALSEGFGDVLGTLAEMDIRGPGHESAFCLLGDGRPGCVRDLRTPGLSTPAHPSRYTGENFCFSNVQCDDTKQPPACCDEHRNSTVLSHWFYLLTSGDQSHADDQCGYVVNPLTDNLMDSAHLASNLLFETLRDGFMPEAGGFEDLAIATVSKAASQFESSAQVESVVNAWAAVNVREKHYASPENTVSPARASKKVNPWILFEWPREDGTAWDFQLGRNGSFTGTELLHDKRGITQHNGRHAQYKIALPENSLGNYTWRVRKARGNEPWQDCHPIHWFDDTGVPPVTLLTVKNVGSDGLIKPGTIEVDFDTIRGATKYEVSYSETDNGCAPGIETDTLTQGLGTEYETQRTAFLHGLQANRTYYVQLKSIGPPALDGGAAPFKCVTRQFSTGGLPAPELREPLDGRVYGFEPPHAISGAGEALRFRWYAEGAPGRFVVTTYPILNGECDRSRPSAYEAPDQCTSDGCEVFVQPGSVISTPNPAGYCWTVTSHARTGNASATSAERRFYYSLGMVAGQTPGTQLGLIESDISTGLAWPTPEPNGVIPHSWNAYPGAAHYTLRVGKWPWRVRSTAPVPANCLGPFCLDGPIEQTFLGDVAGTMHPLPATGSGRYCYQVWPHIAGSVQPFVYAPATYCYTTAPAMPEFRAVRREVVYRYTAVAKFPYLPHGTVPQILGATTQETPSESCTPVVQTNPFAWAPGENWLYNDRRDCEIPFTVVGLEGSNPKTVKARVLQEGQTTPVHELAREFRFLPCGGKDELCCDGGNCEGSLECKADFCRECGGEGQDCCRDSRACQGEKICTENKCHECGGLGERCCPG
jgi:hypothetical protein